MICLQLTIQNGFFLLLVPSHRGGLEPGPGESTRVCVCVCVD